LPAGETHDAAEMLEDPAFAALFAERKK
jgi:hypothetical protein